jgi:nitric oxide reductase NorE protein
MTAPLSARPRGDDVGAYSAAEDGIWLFVLGDLLIYSLLFLLYMNAFAGDPEGFRAGQDVLSTPIAVVNTLILLTSSWLVARAVWCARSGDFSRSGRFLCGAIFCAAAFVCLKTTEYGIKIQYGWYLTSNDFSMYYYVLTGLHLVHVLVGLVVLMLMLGVVRAGVHSDNSLRGFEGGAVYWHLVDLLWLMLFPLLYLIR